MPVSISKPADALVDAIKPFARRTMREGVLGGIGGFGALFEISKKYREPVLVSVPMASVPNSSWPFSLIDMIRSG